MLQPQVYSYVRFSDMRQSTGHSAERQADYATKWAAENGLTLDTSLTLKDEGLSAYHQVHVRKGALGVFLQAVDDGRIPKGSVLIVEGLDRLSRAEPIQAQAQLSQIINAGITVVTASDNKVYSRESLRAQPMDLVYSLLISIRAHEESDTKSKRVKASIRRQCEGWMAGTNRTIIRNGKDPAWLKWTGTAWELIPERVAAVQLAMQMYMQGHGALKIVRDLAEQGMSFTEKGVESQQIYRTVRLRALIGEKTMELDGIEYNLPGYYPPIMSDADFTKLQSKVLGRVRQKGKGDIPGIISGISVLYCGYCGNPLTSQNMEHRRKTDGTFANGHRRLLCVGYTHNRGCQYPSCSIVPVENAILDFCADQMNLTSLVSGSDAAAPVVAKLAKLRTNVATLNKKIERITAAMLDDESGAPKAFIRKAQELEEQLAQEQQAITQTEYELASVSNHRTPAVADAWMSARDGAKALDYESRMKVRNLVQETFSRIVVYQRGVTPTEKNHHMEILLVAKYGNTRLIKVHRFTGKWQAMEDYAATAA